MNWKMDRDRMKSATHATLRLWLIVRSLSFSLNGPIYHVMRSASYMVIGIGFEIECLVLGKRESDHGKAYAISSSSIFGTMISERS